MTKTAENADLAPLLNRLFAGEILTTAEAREVMGQLMDGRVSEVQAAALLAALRTRGESVEEITGFAEAMRARAVRVPWGGPGPLLDTCGTGGTGISTLNISTTALFVVAAGGVKVAKHGNRGVTKRSGSADLLEALGVRIEQEPEELARSLEETGIAFLFARSHHPAMRFVAPIRGELKARTVFNVLGPLTNPAGATRQLLGVFDPALTEQLARVLSQLGVERALVVHGDGLDDFSITGENVVSELEATGEIRSYRLAPEEVGLKRHPLEALAGGDPEANARIVREVLSGVERGAKRDIVLFNAGAGLYLGGCTAGIREGVARAAELINGGAALETFEAYVAFNA
ncbi:MAG: anthranilate phosphoribosyltransferase [Truepera sp.]|nr:anthranilate phosphoribosyltransferase [Truepera sp.]